MTTITTAIATPVTKTSVARSIFEQMKSKGYARKDILNMFVSEAGMTVQGAATAFYNFTKMMKEGKLTIDGVVVTAPAAVATKPAVLAPAEADIFKMHDIELAMFYAKYSPTPNAKLKEREELLEAVMAEVQFEVFHE